jgi:hypothetical protein
MTKKTITENKRKDKKKPSGRPTKLTQEVMDMFTNAVSIGASYILASRYAGVSVEVTAHWMREGRKELSRRDNGESPNENAEPYLRFLRETRVAEAEAGIEWQTVLNKAAKVDPQWAFKMLRVRFPNDYAEVDTTANVEIPPEMTIEFLDRIIAGEPAITIIREWKAWNELQPNSSPGDKTKKK